MLKELISERKVNNKVASAAAGWWGKMLLDPYNYIYGGNVKIKLHKSNSLSVEQVMIFEDILKRIIQNKIKRSKGLVTLHSYDLSLKDAAMAARIDNFPDGYFPKGACMFIDSSFLEYEPQVYVHIDGMNNSVKIF